MILLFKGKIERSCYVVMVMNHSPEPKKLIPIVFRESGLMKKRCNANPIVKYLVKKDLLVSNQIIALVPLHGNPAQEVTCVIQREKQAQFSKSKLCEFFIYKNSI